MANSNTLGKRSVWVMILLSVITGNLYQALWFVLRRRDLEKLRSNYKISSRMAWAPFYLGVATLVALLLTAALEFFALVAIAFSLSALIVGIFLPFRVRRMLLDHYHNSGIRISGAMTLFCTVFYLQYKMNRLPGVDRIQPVPDKLMDISAAAERPPAEDQDFQLESQSAKLQQLKELLDAGLLTQAEFDAKRADVTVGDRWAKLKRALDMGLLTQAEYEIKERELLQSAGLAEDGLRVA